jgi:hypothetical protein
LKEKAKTMVTPREEPSKLDGAGNRTIVEVMLNYDNVIGVERA